MRLFIAVNFSKELKIALIKIQEQLRSQCRRGNFTRPENLHLTLAFLGETPEEKLTSLFRIIEAVKLSPFEIPFNRTGCFTHSQKELWWIGSAKDSSAPGSPENILKDIHGRLLSKLLEGGFPVDKRPFNAHITLGREIKHLNEIVLNCPEIIVKVDHLSLMKSENIKGVLTYTEMIPEGGITIDKRS